MRNCTHEIVVYLRDASEKIQLDQEHGVCSNDLSNQRATSEEKQLYAGDQRLDTVEFSIIRKFLILSASRFQRKIIKRWVGTPVDITVHGLCHAVTQHSTGTDVVSAELYKDKCLCATAVARKDNLQVSDVTVHGLCHAGTQHSTGTDVAPAELYKDKCLCATAVAHEVDQRYLLSKKNAIFGATT
eukprot:s1968_g28.t1